MSVVRSWILVAGLAVLWPTAARGADVTVTDTTITLANEHVRRVLERADGVWRTVMLSRADGSDAVDLASDEFRIVLMNGAALTISDYEAFGDPDISRSGDETILRLVYLARADLPDGAPGSLRIEYMLGEDPYLRKRIVLAMEEGDAVDVLEVERFRTRIPCDRGGRGQPVFIGSAWFVGLEYPGSETGCDGGLVTLAHFPGYAKTGSESMSQWTVTSKTAVAGVGAKGDPIELAFSDYVDTIRRPSRSFLQYNSWYDWRGDELSPENLIATFEEFKRSLLDPFGLQMDAFVPDDGYQDPNSIWMPKKRLYPDGFSPLRDALQARGGRLGIWMPFDGTNLNVDWGAQQGYEKSDRGGFYCLAGPKYNEAIRAAIKRIILQGNLFYFKHDFNHLSCTGEGHGHLPDDRHGREANLDAELALLAYERELQPQIFLNVTSFVWHSPWWLAHADSIWMNAGDHGYNTDWPQLSPREWAMSYRDAHFYQLYAEQRDLVPVSAMMTHGIISGRYCKLGGDRETLREWSDYVVMYYGRGVQLKELYITPAMMTPEVWEVLGRATRWAIDNREILDNVVMVGGDPRKGEPYGYVHWKGERCIVAVRNPDLPARSIEIPFDKSVRYRGELGRAYRGRAIYPYVEQMPDRFVSGSPMTLRVPGCSVMVYEFEPGEAASVDAAAGPAPIQAEAAVTHDGDGGAVRIAVQVDVPDEDMQRCDLYILAKGAASGLTSGRVLGLREDTPVREADGPGWHLYSVDLRSHAGDVEPFSLDLTYGEPPFGAIDASMNVWLVADRPVGSAAAGAGSLPMPIAQGYRRQTVEILPTTAAGTQRVRIPVTEEDLATITAAKLRILVFDSNPEPQYRDKFISLNGRTLARIPANEGRLSRWQEFIIDLDPEQLDRVRIENTLELGNAGGDCYKFTGLTLAVKLHDGRWAETNTDDTVHSSTKDWRYFEGGAFEQDTSGPIELSFEQPEASPAGARWEDGSEMEDKDSLPGDPVAPVMPEGRRVIEPFDYRGVTLEGGELKRQFDETRALLLRIPNDDLLKGFRARAGLPSPGVEMGGWYSRDIGNTFGQVLSALARMYAATGDVACRDKAAALVHEWSRCIGDDGYPFYSLHPAGACYTYDKLVGGLVDMFLYCSNDEAIGCLDRITDWAMGNLDRSREYANADGAGMPRAAGAEWYTLSENLYRAYLATGRAKYRDFAQIWEYTEYWDLFARGADIFGVRPNGARTGAYHAYSHVNTLSSAAAAYLVTGERRYLDALTNAYEFLWGSQVYATGGYGPDESLLPRDRLIAALAETKNHTETQCGTWAAFKLVKYLISFTGDARYGDWAERLLYNCIGASLPMSDHGRVFYYASYHLDGAEKRLYGDGWACCAGSRPMAIADYHDQIYFHDARDLYVNLFVPSTVAWDSAGAKVSVRQRTRFPEADSTQFALSMDASRRFAVKLRMPEWLASPMSVSVNGASVEPRVDDRHWAVVEREWHDGDTLSVKMPMRFRLSRMDDARGYPAAVLYGPVVMAFRSPEGNPSAGLDYDDIENAFVPCDGEALTYHPAADASVLVRPLYAFREGETYYVYLDPGRAARGNGSPRDATVEEK